MLTPIIQGMGRVLAYFFSIIPNYGLAIIMLTVLVRVLMIPLAIKQAHSMRANRGNQEKIKQLAPEVKKIKEKYRNDRARIYEEQKKLYDKHDVNMLGGLGGCVPTLLQAPIFMAMYAVLQGCDKLFGTGRVCELGQNIPAGSALHSAIIEGRDTFLGMNLNLSPTEVWGGGSVLAVLPYAALVILMGVTMFIQSRQMMRMQPAGDPQMAQTQKIMQFMPLMIVVFSINFPTGLTVYWTASNVWGIGQQTVLLKWYGGSAPAKPGGGKTSRTEPTGLRARLKAAAAESDSGSGKASKGGAATEAKGAGGKTRSTGAKDGGGKGRPTPKRPPKGATAAERSKRSAATRARPGSAKRGGTGSKRNDGSKRKSTEGQG